MREEAMIIDGHHPLAGVLTRPATPTVPETPVVLLLNAGLVHHAGPNRLAVKVARTLAQRGFTVLRFDHAGMGDSANREDNLPFECAAVQDVVQVMDHLCEEHEFHRFVLVGLCSGAQTAYRAACTDMRAVGAVLINGGAHSQDQDWNRYVIDRESARAYWQGALLRPESWKKLLTGRSQYRRLLRVLWRQLRNLAGQPPAIAAVSEKLCDELGAMVARDVRLLCIHSSDDLSLDYVTAIFGTRQRRALEASGNFTLDVIRHADHTFTLHRAQRSLLERLETWFDEQFPRNVPVRPDGPETSRA